jgi:hypothetical protein
MNMEKYSMGIGDRFGHQGLAQLAGMQKAQERGVTVVPVWNKSNREHSIIGTVPADVRREADAAVKTAGWKAAYYVDADHIGLANVDKFMDASNFFTLDVADYIGKPAPDRDVQGFVSSMEKYVGALRIPGIDQPLTVTAESIRAVAAKYLGAVAEAAQIYRRIESAKGQGTFVTEVSMDEANLPQTPVEMFFILGAIAQAGIPAGTIAPKFTGRFNKGVDYVGDVAQFTREFEQDLAVIRHAIREFGLPPALKLSVHSGSDKFSLYAPIHRALRKFDAGLHLKTAGTTWLEELIGLAMAGSDGLTIAQECYRAALDRFDEMCKPYAPVIDIDPARLPKADEVAGWSGAQLAAALRHDPACKAFNPHFRQLMHVGYKVAAEMGDRFLKALEKHRAIIARNVTENVFDRHILPIFIGK